MNQNYTLDQIKELLPVYALGALEPDEMLAVEGWLRDHPSAELETLLTEAEDAMQFMALTAAPQPLNPAVKTRLMAEIRRNDTVPPVAPPVTPVRNLRRVPQPAPELVGTPGLWAQLVNLLRPVGWVAVGAAAMALLFLLPGSPVNRSGAELAAVQAEAQRLQGEVDSFEATITQLDSELDVATERVSSLESDLQAVRDENLTLQQVNQSLQSQNESNQQQLAVLARTTNAVALGGTEAAPDAVGTLYIGDGEGVLVLAGLQTLAEASTYQLWLIPAEGDPVSAGLLPAFQTTTNALTLPLPSDATDYAAVGISIEPAGGSQAPTGPIVLVGTQS